jgi:chromosome segregation ATPase
MQLGAAPDHGASESDEARYSRHLEILLKFYAKHDSSKTQAQVVAIIAKRKGAAAALDEDIFVEVCGKLENKYGENPLVLFAPVHASDSSASAVDPEMADLLQDDREEEADEDGDDNAAQQADAEVALAYGDTAATANSGIGGPAMSQLNDGEGADSADVLAADEPEEPAVVAMPETPAPSSGAIAIEPRQSLDAMAVETSTTEASVPAVPAGPTDVLSAPLAQASEQPVDVETDSARYSRHLEILLKFYAKHDSSKTQAQVVAIIAKRKGAAAALDEDIFVEVCGKLENKYGENPLVLFAPKLAVLPAAGGSEAHSGTLTSEGMDVEQTASEAVAATSTSPVAAAATSSPSTVEVTNSAAAAAAVAAPALGQQAYATERSTIDTEQDLHRVEQQYYRCKIENQKLVKLCAEQKRQLQDVQNESVARSKITAEEQRSANAARVAADEVFAQKEALDTENTQLRKALDEKAVAIQARDKELEDFTARIVRTNALKAQAQDDHHDAAMKLQRARRDMSVAKEEAELARQESRSSDSEVQRLNEELLRLRKEKSARERELHEEVDKLRSAHDRQKPGAKAGVDDDNAERDKLQARVRELEADAAKAKADAEEEMRNQQKLTQLYKESQEDGDLKAAELHVMLAAKADECERLKREHTEASTANETRIAQLEEQERAASQNVQALKQRLEEVKEFGDGAFSPPVKDESGKKRRFDVSGLSESAALAQRYAGVSSVVLASRYEKSQVELRKAKEESKKLQSSLDEVLVELEKRAPTVAKVFEEQELMSKKYSELSAKMSEAAEQNSDLRKQLREAENFRADARQHREVLEREVVTLRKQIGQLMSTPVQTGSKRRRGSRPQLTDRPQYRAAGTTMALPPPAAAGASSALVLQDVEGSELNVKQDLERKVIELQVQCETLREANSESALQAKLTESVAELDEVRGHRKQMEDVITSITRQRDSYMETLKAEIEGNAQTKTLKPASPRKLLPPPSAETQCMQRLSSLQAEYAKSRSQWSARVDELQERVETLSKRASSAEIAHAQQQAELEHVKLVASDYESQEKDMEHRLQLAQTRATESEGLLRDLRSKLDAVDAERSLAQAELARVKSGLESSERRYEATKSREAALQTQYEEHAKAKNAQAVALADALDARQRDSQAHNQEVSTLQTKIDEVVEEKTALEAKLLRQQDAHEANRAALSSMSKARDGAEELVLSLRSSQDGLRQQCAQLTAKLNEANAAAATASATQKAQDGSTVGLTTEESVNLDVANLRAELTSSADQIVSLKQHIADYKQLVQHSESQVKQLREAAQEQTTTQASAGQQLAVAEQRCNSLTVELGEVKAKVASSATALQAKEAEVAAAEAAKGTADRRAGQLQAQLAAKTAELAKTTSALSELTTTSEAAKVEMAKLQVLAKQVEAARAETAAAQGALSRTEAKGHEAVRAMQKTLDTTAAEMRDLRAQNEMLLGQLDRAMNSLATDSW